MKKAISLMIMIAFLICCFPFGAIAVDTDNEQTGVPSDPLAPNGGFSYDSIEEMMLDVSKQIHEQLNKETLNLRSYPTIMIGDDETATSADYSGTMEDNDWGSPDISRSAGLSYGGWADCEVDVSMELANGKAWAYLGNVYEIVADGGTTSGDCRITFRSDDDVDGYLWSTSNPTSGSQVAVWGEIYDKTDDCLVDQFEDWYVQNQCGFFGDELYVYGTVELEAGHEYSVIMVVYTEAYNYWPRDCWADSYSGGYGGQGMEYGYISFDWL